MMFETHYNGKVLITVVPLRQPFGLFVIFLICLIAILQPMKQKDAVLN